jgi:hypothetical protein
VGFGDAVTPEPQTVEFPILLSDLTAPTLRVYPVYTVIAEEYHAMTTLGLANSRLNLKTAVEGLKMPSQPMLARVCVDLRHSPHE